ncbi:MAG TPA: ABC transporter permease [Longimicrobiales bacterium]
MRIESLGEGIALAFEQLRANKIRSALTILGVIVGVATVMAMSALITGIRTSIMEGIEAAGPKNFVVARFDFNTVRISDGGEPPWAGKPPITIEEIRGIGRLDKIRRAIANGSATARIEFGSQRFEDVQINASGPAWGEYTHGSFPAGHDFLPADVRASRPVIVLSQALAEGLFGRLDPIGRAVQVNGVRFRVVGTFEPAGNIFADVTKHFAVVPYTSALKYLAVDRRWLNVLVVTAADATQDEAIDEVITYLRTSRGLRPAEPNNFAIIRQEEMADSFNRLTGIFFMVMLALSSVGLMVGGVGVIGTMTIAVTERTREIGVRKALGATRKEILWQFLIEAVTVTLAGAAVGMALGAGLAFLVAGLTPIPASIPAWAVAAALLMAAIAGVLFGLWPAWRAARLDPVVALRHE